MVKQFFLGMWCVCGSILLVAWYIRMFGVVRAWASKYGDSGDSRNPFTLLIAAAFSFPIALAATVAFGVTCSGVSYTAGVFLYDPDPGFFSPFLISIVVFAIPMGCLAAAAFLKLTWPRAK